MDDAAVKAVGDELRALKERLKQEAGTHISHTHSASNLCFVGSLTITRKSDQQDPAKLVDSLGLGFACLRQRPVGMLEVFVNIKLPWAEMQQR